MTDIIPFDAAFGTRFSVSIDTEEEFDWSGNLSRDGHGVATAAALASGQHYFEQAHVVPAYYVDRPIIDSDVAIKALGPALAGGAAEIGVHLHPWVSPPFIETINRHNSYAGNLDRGIEREKIYLMQERIVERLGVKPIAYRAGRYGIGPNSYDILTELGFRIDSSYRPLFDYRHDGGPDFRRSSPHPHWTSPSRSLIELPLSSHFLGWGGRLKPILFNRVRGRALLSGIAARTGVVERVPLTPEGTPPDRACAMIDHGLEQGVRLFSMSFHSPSLAPGYTPYVRDTSELASFYRWFDTIFAHCVRRGIANASLAQIVEAADAVR
ncbi:MAG: polysaccharide deacetylase family protein [Sphingopyxis sp.]